MKISQRRFTVLNALFTVSLMALLMGIGHFMSPDNLIFLAVPPIIVGVLSQVGFHFLSKAIKKEKNNEFLYGLVISTFLRLIIGILANLLVILLWKSQSFYFVIAYFFAYFFLTSFEVYVIMYNLRADSKVKR